MTRLVAVDIAADQAVLRDVLVVRVCIFGKVVVEEFVKGGYEFLLSTHQCHGSVDILGNVEGEIQRIAFDEAFSNRLHDVEVFLEGPVRVLRPAEAEISVEYISVVQRPGGIFLRNGIVAQEPGGIPDGPVVV